MRVGPCDGRGFASIAVVPSIQPPIDRITPCSTAEAFASSARIHPPDIRSGPAAAVAVRVPAYRTVQRPGCFGSATFAPAAPSAAPIAATSAAITPESHAVAW